MQQYLTNKKTEPFQEGQEAWNGYYISSWKLKPENPYNKHSKRWIKENY